MKRATSEAQRHPRAGRSRGLFKIDHPRAIDRYIDYFGGPTGDAGLAELLDRFGDLVHEDTRAVSHG
jgi:hypothetical protein